MKKKMVVLLLVLSFLATGLLMEDKKVYAEERTSSTEVDLSEIWTEDALVGYATNQTRGVYLAEGVSIINDAGGGKIGCGGITSAAKRCKVSCTSIVERKIDGSWKRVTSWTDTKENSFSASVSECLYVTSGYYYRVRSSHYASTDSCSSYTEGLKM